MSIPRVVDIGNCGADHGALSRVLERHFKAELTAAHGAAEALRMLRAKPPDLVLVNRILDADGSEGLDIICEIKSDPQLRSIPVMMITNYDEHQQMAVQQGAEPGFGKNELGSPAMLERLGKYLVRPTEGA